MAKRFFPHLLKIRFATLIPRYAKNALAKNNMAVTIPARTGLILPRTPEDALFPISGEIPANQAVNESIKKASYPKMKAAEIPIVTTSQNNFRNIESSDFREF